MNQLKELLTEYGLKLTHEIEAKEEIEKIKQKAETEDLTSLQLIRYLLSNGFRIRTEDLPKMKNKFGIGAEYDVLDNVMKKEIRICLLKSMLDNPEGKLTAGFTINAGSVIHYGRVRDIIEEKFDELAVSAKETKLKLLFDKDAKEKEVDKMYSLIREIFYGYECGNKLKTFTEEMEKVTVKMTFKDIEPIFDVVEGTNNQKRENDGCGHFFGIKFKR